MVAMLAMLGLALAPATPATAEEAGKSRVLSLVPDDASIVVLVPSLEKVSRDLEMLNNNLDLEVPQMADAIGSLRDQLGVRGLDEKGAAALVMRKLPIPEPGEDFVGGEPEVLLLVPVSDFDAMVGGFNAEDAGNGLHRFTIENTDPIFARRVGDHAVLGPSRDAVADYEAGNGAGKRLIEAAGSDANAIVERSSISVLINVAELGPKLRPLLEQGAEQQLMMMQMMMGNDGAMMEGNVAMMRMAFNAMDLLLRDTRGAVIGLEAGGAGAMMNLGVAFHEDSELGRYVQAGEGAPKLLSRVPNRSFMFAMAADSSALNMAGLYELLTRVLDEDLKDNPMLKGVTSALEMAKLSKGSSSVMFAPRGGLMGLAGGFEGVSVYEVEDVDRFVAAHRQSIEDMAELELDMGAGPGAAMKYRTEYEEDVAEIEGVKVHRYSVEMEVPQAMMAELGPMAGMMQGLAGQKGHVAVKGDRVIVTTGRNIDIVRDALRAVDAESGLGSDGVIPRVRRVMDMDNAAAEGYLDIKPMAEIVAGILPMMGGPQIRVPADLQPLAVAAKTRDGELSARFFAPMSVGRFVRDLVDVFEQLDPGPAPGQPHQPGNGAPRPPAF